jgi:sugar phosphate isomerase/epimerase
MEPTIQLAQEAGAKLVVIHTPRAESLEEGDGLAFRQRIEAWQPRLQKRGLRLALENKAIHQEVDRRYALSPLVQLRAFADHYDLDLVLDTTHAGTAGEDLLQAWHVLDGRLTNVHLSDMGGHLPLGNIPYVRQWFGEHRFPGIGDLSLAGLLAELARSEYAGLITLEVSPFAVAAWWPASVRRHLAQAATWMRRAAASETPRSR